ncbi:hypothetical protein ACTXT7_010804 [Hymenolepis weldensis]
MGIDLVTFDLVAENVDRYAIATVMSLCTYDSKPPSVMSKRVYRFPPFYNHPISIKVHRTNVLTRVLAQVTRINYLGISTHTHDMNVDTRASYRLLRFPLISFVPHLSLTCSNPHRDHRDTHAQHIPAVGATGKLSVVYYT